MDVTRLSFSQHLPRLLNDLAESSFVALDLEFSGIVTRQPGSSPANGLSGGKQTLQARYEEAKDAAEAYQVLQIGLTFARENVKTGTYVLRPYNLHLNPVLDPKLGIERRWSYQSSAIDFLIKSGFRMEAPFADGLPYLSRLEETKAMAKLAEREHNMATIADIKLEEMDEESLAFLNEVRGLIESWIGQTEDKEDYLNIPEPCGLKTSRAAGALGSGRFNLNSYQKRLVHQLVRAEYPSLVTIGRQNFIQIIPYDKQREEYIRVDKSRLLGERLVQQTGFRWVVEGMVGGDLTPLDPRIFTGCVFGPADAKDLLKFSDDLKSKLKSKHPILVGHNLFTDLINFYKCFIGDLPDRVEDFQEAIHALFPLVIDTKYMATHDCSSGNPSSSLTEINESLMQRETPKICVHPEHDKYLDDKPLHEAGYDSLLTARVLIRLASKLQGEKPLPSHTGQVACIPQPILLADSAWTPLKTAPTMQNRGENQFDKLLDGDEADRSDSQSFSSSTSLASIFDKGHCKKPGGTTVPKQSPVNWSKDTEISRIRSLFSAPSACAPLSDRTIGAPINRLPLMDVNSPFRKLHEEAMIRQNRKKAGLIPQFSDEFWKIYGNKLRVFGTVEEMCDLTRSH
ncbi:hypothetical protein AJ79_02425 [Helicocarpus griseus UAMH5409]|uniref:Uncharacterized protein n=1 Tax=Helicocarpus griseus UAMH5409 TaxID=1447875 RepID=A0A2B7Y3P6_9EURO|nr:hypothetical protein AJ79_02425 [Helicocarpus griseus UAMH5409]